MFFYRAAGLVIASDIELPGWALRSGGPSDASIRGRPVPRALEGARERGPTWELSDDRLLLRIPGVARFLLSDGREIDFEAEDGVLSRDLAIFLTDTVFGLLLHQRRRVVLHASAVEVAGKAVLFSGESGAGKSTLAAAMAERGFPLLTDDVCVITVEPSPVAFSAGQQLKLWQRAIAALGMEDRRGAPVRGGLQKYFIQCPAATAESLPLGAVYVLRPLRPPLVAGIERPNVVDATLLLQRDAYRPLMVQRMGQRADYFRAATRIANAVGLFCLTRPLDFDALGPVVAQLEHHWRGLGLTASPP